MADLTALLESVKPDIEKIEKAIEEDVNNLAAEMDDLLLEILRYGLFSGGKRFRPLLAVIAARLCGGDKEEVYKLAIAFEYLHLATLFHDDVIDQADTRRGKPSVSHAYGLAPAILVGDFLHARSMAIIGEYGGSAALKIFCEATSGMVDGEFLQLRNARNYNQSEDDYFRVIHGKTALLIAATTEIGAQNGGGDKNNQMAMRHYGMNLGYAFQIVDDLLDYRGDSNTTGKAVGNDLVEGKMTLPLILTIASARDSDKERFYEILSNPDLRKKSFDEVVDLVNQYQGFEQTEERAQQCIDKAIGQLSLFPRQGEREKQILIALAHYAVTRQK